MSTLLPDNDDISVAILDFLDDGEIHTLRATIQHLVKHFHLKSREMDEMYYSRKINLKEHPYSSKKIYTKTVLVISALRRANFLQDFPGTKKIGVFFITDKGMTLITKNRDEISKTINLELNKYYKKKKIY